MSRRHSDPTSRLNSRCRVRYRPDAGRGGAVAGGPETGGTPPPRPDGTPAPSDPIAVPTSPDLVADSMISRPLTELMARTTARQRIGVVIELSSTHPEGIEGAARDVEALLRRVAPRAPVRPTRSYVITALTRNEIRKVVQEEQKRGSSPRRDLADEPCPRWAIHRIWPNFEVNALIHRTVVTTKCDAAQRSFNATGDRPCLGCPRLRHRSPACSLRAARQSRSESGDLTHRSFTTTSDDDALHDLAGHGTHVAGILAGEQIADEDSPIIAATWYHDDSGDSAVHEISLQRISGMAPRCKLLSCKVLRDDGSGDLAALLEALEYIQDLNNGGRDLKVHGVNLRSDIRSIHHGLPPV